MFESLTNSAVPRKAAFRLARYGSALVLVFATVWVWLALWFQAPMPAALRGLVASAVAAIFLFTALSILARRWLRWSLPAAIAFGLAIALWWTGIRPSNDRDWQPEVSRQADISIKGDDVLVRNVRMFDWTGPHSATPAWEDRIYALSDLRALDLFTSTWGNDNIAHMVLSFSFGSGPPLALSLEIRKENGEEYSPLAGFFKKYDLALIAADESDIVKVRSNWRGETVRRYRIDVKRENAVRLLVSYARLSQELAARPRFYHTIWTNCTTTIYGMLRAISPADFPFDYRVLLSGRTPEYLYRLGFIENGQPFDEVRRRADITMKARLAMTSTDFSSAIRR